MEQAVQQAGARVVVAEHGGQLRQQASEGVAGQRRHRGVARHHRAEAVHAKW